MERAILAQEKIARPVQRIVVALRGKTASTTLALPRPHLVEMERATPRKAKTAEPAPLIVLVQRVNSAKPTERAR
jgi:hypothetical protein